MRNLLLTTALLLLVILQCTIVSCHRKAVVEDRQLGTAVFPDDWIGDWKGLLEIHKVTGKSMEVPMLLTIEKTNHPARFNWIIQYGVDSTADARLYELVVVDAATGHYQVDEKNTIVIDSYLFENRLVSAYDVMGNAIDITYEYHGDKLTFDLIMYASEKGIVTGDSIYNGDEIPAVTSYPVKTMQKAVLRKL